MTLRIGHGVDAHRLTAGRPLLLGCVQLDHDRGLAGHSDGDVVVHALCDALLGAAGQGDMGRHFPSSEERWRDTPGAEFLAAVARILSAQGVSILSAHVVVIAEEPRLAAHLAAMSEACAAALAVDRDLLQVTATSSDGLGFTGRAEGIAASAVVLVERAS
ncbi:2-C-methyl-D-erythritol 2,4-cyclodiphosphate synthase [Candidatus Aeolococcus gillhamiae]|uniref:2-C-methyl-D-erythritol 2,4-cyclodiphosphate synthase n=1 Tax=Candidatus Aeolococcus gillhamiae TaxID=3127015 RepID=UPI003077724E